MIERKGWKMIEILDDGSSDVFAMRVSGKLLHRDYQQFVPVLEKLIEKKGSVRCLIEMIDFQGMELRTFWDEIKFDVRRARRIKRCAVVGDRAWEAWMTKLSKLIFLNADVRYFNVSERDQARAWIKEDDESDPAR